MAANTINYTFPIYYDVNGEKTPFYNLVLRKVVVDSVVMSLGDKITGEAYYENNSLLASMKKDGENISLYVEYKGVKYYLVDPPTILREGLVSDNSELKGMTKYSFTFYHPMYQLSNMPFTDVAVSENETKYLSQNSTFSWTGTGVDFIAKLNKNLQGTQWIVVANENDVKSMAKLNSLPDEIEPTKAGQEPNSNVLSFDNVMISDALKKCYDTWKVPFVIDQIKEREAHYSEGKRYLILFGLPSNEIYETDGNGNVILDENDEPKAFVFKMGQGVGLKNNSRNPKNNKIITRIAGYGSTDNIQYGYPQIVWSDELHQDWDYTINNDPNAFNSYPICDGIINGQKVRLIQHPFTRDVLMPSIYRETVNKKVNPNADWYNPYIEIKDYYDAPNNYPNPINLAAPSYQKQAFDGIKPRLQDQYGEDYGIVENAVPYEPDWTGYKTFAQWRGIVADKLATTRPQRGVRSWAHEIWSGIASATNVEEQTPTRVEAAYWEKIAGSTTASVTITLSGHFFTVKLVSDWENNSWRVLQPNESIDDAWDDTYDAEKDEYVQSYFTIKLPQLGRQVNGQWTGVDIYACASVTQEMKINMRSGACQGCTFPVEVDWEDYRKNFYKEVDGKVVFDPVIHTTDGDGHVRDGNKYPDSRKGQITLLLKKEIETFGTLMPNIYQQPKGESEGGANDGDKFVILGISLPQSYVTNAETLLDETMMQYMLENNVHYFDYPLKFDEHFLVTHQDILAQMRNNTIVRFEYPRENGVENALYIKQMTIKYGDNPLPQYDITLTDDVEIVLNQIGQVTDDVSRMRVQMNELQKYYGDEVIARINEKLSKVADDVAQGRITFQQGLDTIGDAFIHGTIGSPQFETGLYTGKGWRIDNLGNAEMESLRVRSYLEIVELLVNRMQAQEGDTMFSDNDQIEKVDYAYIEYETQSGDNPMSLGLYELSEDDYTYVLTSDTTVIPNKTYYYQDGYILSLKEKWDGYITSQQVGNILKGTINTLAAKQAGISDVTTTDVYYTSWMQVTEVGSSESNTLGVNQIRVVLYGDNQTPAGRNFVPCELMTIARWGNILNPDEQGITENEKKRRRALQSSFYISTSEGRIAKLTGVNKPILESFNYGTTLGIVPDFVKNWSIANRLIDGRDYLYAQGVIVGDFIKVDIEGNPLINYVDKGEWQGNTEYLVNEYNGTTLQYETHEVWHNGALWRAKMHQPVVSGGVTTYYEPTDNNSAYWQKLMASGDSAQNIYYRGNSAPDTPTGDAPQGWTTYPQGVSQSLKNEYISTRIKSDGTWGSWSTPALFAHYAEDGTSISITGSALKHYNTWAAFISDAQKVSGGTYIVNENSNQETKPIIAVWNSGATTTVANIGDAYLVQEDGHLYHANSSNAPWNDLGQIKGDKGDNGDSNATVFIYKRSASQPTDTDKPTATITYSFADGSLSGSLNGWSAIIPQSDGNPCWVRQVFVSSDSPTITIAPTSWSTANKYTEDGKDGVSFEAQYSPDMIQVHTTWQSGDLYMRTRATNASWSNWQRIIGEDGANGDYTDYSFGISALLETASPTTSPTDITTWADAPIKTTPQYPYLWSKVIKYIWVNGVKTADSTTYIRLTGEQGASINITNKSVKYQVSDSGTTPPTGTWVDNVPTVGQGQFLWTRTIVTYSDGNSTTSYAVSRNGVNGSKGEKGDTGTSVSVQSTDVTYAVTQDSTQPSDEDFDGPAIPPLSLGDYLWSKEVIRFSDGKSIKSYSVSRIGTDGAKGDTGANGSSTHFAYATSADGSENFSTTLFSGATYIGTYTNTTVEDSPHYYDYEWTKLKGEQGEQGENAVTYEVQVSQDKITIPSGQTSSTTTMHFRFYSKEGNFIKTTFSTYWSLYKRNSGGTMELVLSITNKTSWLINYSLTATTSESAFVMYIWGNNRYTGNNPESQSYLAKAEVVVLKNGDNGARGKVGRFYYFAGTFNDEDYDTQFVVNDAQVPYFEHLEAGQKRYHVFNPETIPEGGSMTMAQMWAASNRSWNNAPWEVMTNDFKYLITEALFGKYANLGSFIINEDWLMSNLGSIAGNTNSQITYKEWKNNNWVDMQAPAYTFFDATELKEDKTGVWDIPSDGTWLESGVAELSYQLYYFECSITDCKIKLCQVIGEEHGMPIIGEEYILAAAPIDGTTLPVSFFLKVPQVGENYMLVLDDDDYHSPGEISKKGGFYEARFVPYIAIDGSNGQIYHSGGSGSFYAKWLEMAEGNIGMFRVLNNWNESSLISSKDITQNPDKFTQLTEDGQLVLIHDDDHWSTQVHTPEALHVEGQSSFSSGTLTVSSINIGRIVYGGSSYQLVVDNNGFLKLQNYNP